MKKQVMNVNVYKVNIQVYRQERNDQDEVQYKERALLSEEVVEAPWALKALGIVLRRAMEIPLALMAAAGGDDPYRGRAGG